MFIALKYNIHMFIILLFIDLYSKILSIKSCNLSDTIVFTLNAYFKYNKFNKLIEVFSNIYFNYYKYLEDKVIFHLNIVSNEVKLCYYSWKFEINQFNFQIVFEWDEENAFIFNFTINKRY
jgi:hypothetical protein